MVMGLSLALYQEVIVGLSRGLLPRIILRRCHLMIGIHRNHVVLRTFLTQEALVIYTQHLLMRYVNLNKIHPPPPGMSPC